MAISFTKPTLDTTPPEPPVNRAEAERIRAANDAKFNAVATATDSLVTQSNLDVLNIAKLNALAVQHVASGASLTGLTAGSTYKYLVLTYGETYNSAASGSGTGTALMAATASGNAVVAYWVATA